MDQLESFMGLVLCFSFTFVFSTLRLWRLPSSKWTEYQQLFSSELSAMSGEGSSAKPVRQSFLHTEDRGHT